MDTGTATLVAGGYWVHPSGSMIYTPFVLEDGSDREIEVVPINSGDNRGYVHVKVKVPSGAVIKEGRFLPAAGTKISGASAELRGTHLHIAFGSYLPGGGDEQMWLQEYVYDLTGYVTPRGSGGGGTGRSLPVVPPGQQTFSDVAPDNPFWLGVETLKAMNVLGGYEDGTFRPNNPLTRGQVAKIIVNALRYVQGQ
jgi:hypothetical protein